MDLEFHGNITKAYFTGVPESLGNTAVHERNLLGKGHTDQAVALVPWSEH
jgi:hypothetical protein